MNNTHSLHARLKKYRELNNLSQLEVAQKLGLSRQSVSRWETGKAYPDLDNIVLLCKLYNITSDELLGINDNENIPITSVKDVCTTTKTNIKSPIFSSDFLCVAVILVLSAQFNFIGLLVPFLVAIWCNKRELKHWLIILLCVISFLISLNNSLNFIDHVLFDLGNGYYSPL